MRRLATNFDNAGDVTAGYYARLFSVETGWVWLDDDMDPKLHGEWRNNQLHLNLKDIPNTANLSNIDRQWPRSIADGEKARLYGWSESVVYHEIVHMRCNEASGGSFFSRPDEARAWRAQANYLAGMVRKPGISRRRRGIFDELASLAGGEAGVREGVRE